MKLQLAELFCEHMIFQRGEEILIWGRSAGDDSVTVRLEEEEVTVKAEYGKWKAVLPKREAGRGLTLTFSSALTGEMISFHDVAVGDVFLAGGQSNMEFLMKYDVDFEEVKKSEDDLDLRFYCVPQSPFLGFLEKEAMPAQGYWRRWEGEDNKAMFPAVAAYAAKIIRREEGVPVGIIGCNWGGTPASAWTSIEDVKAKEAFKPVIEEYERNCAQIDFRKYYETSEVPVPVPTKEQLDFEYRFMMGEDMSEFFKNMGNMPKPDISVWSTYPIAPRSATRPGGVYETMLKKVAPFPLRAFLWYQGEDDDARGWADFYDESMKTLILGWRKLWGRDLPFFQVELAPFRGIGMTGAKKYALMRHQQHKVSEELKDVHDLCILDAGEEFNIHPRHKKIVGERLGRLIRKYVYGDERYTADCPSFDKAERREGEITLFFKDCAEGLSVRGDLKEELFLFKGEEKLSYEAEVLKDRVLLKGDFPEGEIVIRYCEDNYPVAKLFNSEGNPVYGFTAEV
ncbi:MAG: hypothetical protein IIZ33_04420 [Erysipelotrichaceae bacterium]|nr:hypothetical protein [Erysipelotrichaceae bacterium]